MTLSISTHDPCCDSGKVTSYIPAKILVQALPGEGCVCNKYACMQSMPEKLVSNFGAADNLQLAESLHLNLALAVVAVTALELTAS